MSNDIELRNIQAGVLAMLTESQAGVLDATHDDIADMDLVTADNGNLKLSSYLTGLDADGAVKSGCTYSFTRDGIVAQTVP